MKRVLIVTSSPFNNTKLGKMCSQLVCHFKKNQSLAVVAAWDHDTSWYSEDENGLCWYEKDEEKVCPVYPVFNIGEGAPNQLFDLIKKLDIQTVVSIGDFHEVQFIYAIKTLEKDNIEWINILNNGSTPINDNKREILNSIDHHIILNNITEKEFNRLGVPAEKYSHIKYGSSFTGEGPKGNSEEFGIACVAKNCNQSNLGCFIKAISKFSKFGLEKDKKFKVYLHTNLYDNGDYDIEYLLDRYGVKDIIELPEEFIGINDGISDDQFKAKLKNYDLIVDCSCQSSTGISVLDGMSLGLIPLVSRVGILGEISKEIGYHSHKYNQDLSFFIEGNDFVAADEKEFYICSDLDLAICMYDYYRIWENTGLSLLSQSSQDISKTYDLQNFLQNTFKIIKDFRLNTTKLVVETF